MNKLPSEKANATVPGTVEKIDAPAHPENQEKAHILAKGEEQGYFIWSDAGCLSETELSGWLETEKQIDAKMHCLEEPEIEQTEDAPSRVSHKAA